MLGEQETFIFHLLDAGKSKIKAPAASGRKCTHNSLRISMPPDSMMKSKQVGIVISDSEERAGDPD